VAAQGHPRPLFRDRGVRDLDAYRAAIGAIAGLLGDVRVLVTNAGNDQVITESGLAVRAAQRPWRRPGPGAAAAPRGAISRA
jgi:hypothetical protein